MAIGVLEQIDSQEKDIEIQTYNLLGIINFNLYQLSNAKNNLSSAKVFFDMAIRIEIEDNKEKNKLLNHLFISKYNKGFALYREKRFEEAKDSFYERYKYDNSALASAHLADAYLNLRDYETALSFYQKSLDQYESSYSLNGIALCYLYTGDFRLANRFAANH